MAIDLDELFGKIGALGGMLNDLNTFRGSTYPAKLEAVYDLYEASNDVEIIDGTLSDLSGWQGSTGGILGTLQTLASNTIVTTVNDDVLQPDRSLSTALLELIRQMKGQSETVQSSVVGISGTSDGTNEGNPVFVYSTKTSDGLNLENLLAETLTGTCVTDAQTSGNSPGSEAVNFSGQQAMSDSLNWQYPLGSGSSTTLNLVDASQDAPGGSGQWLTNGDFESWTVANVPDGWTIATGTAGVQVIEGATAYTGDTSLGLVGDGTTLTAIEQEFGIDNPNSIQPLTQYAFNGWVKADVVAASGVLEIALVDASGNIIQDEAGTDNKVTKNLTSVTTTFEPINGMFRLPRMLPSAVNLRVRFSTVCPSGTTIFIDRLAFTLPYQAYTGGPYLAGFSGDEPLIRGDSFSVTTTNTPGGFQELFDRLFNMKQLQMLLPSSNSPTISDGLIS